MEKENKKQHTGGFVSDGFMKKGMTSIVPPFHNPIQDNKFHINISISKDTTTDEILDTATKVLKKHIEKLKNSGLSFGDAINQLHKGKKVKRAIWGGYWVIEDNEEFGEIIVAYLKDGGKAMATPYNADMLALDWEVVE